MGTCFAKLEAEKAATARDRAFDEQIRLDNIQYRSKIKLLLLGAGESGKSTIFKQMQQIYGRGFSDHDRREMVPIVTFNTLTSIHSLMSACDELNYPILCSASRDVIHAMSDEAAITPTIASHIAALWRDAAIQRAYAERHRFQLNDSASYFLDKVESIAVENYLPTVDDVMRTRVLTSGIREESYRIDDMDYVMFDVGGQRNERRKWIHAFDDVSAVIFVVSLSEYDQMLFEDNLVNRLVEALSVFREICTAKWFDNKPIILFFNKSDLFREKIKHKDLRQLNTNPFTAEREPMLFADYTGGCNYDAALKYIVNKFLQQAMKDEAAATLRRFYPVPPKEVFWQVMCATESSSVNMVFNAAKENILRRNLASSGFSNPAGVYGF